MLQFFISIIWFLQPLLPLGEWTKEKKTSPFSPSLACHIYQSIHRDESKDNTTEPNRTFIVEVFVAEQICDHAHGHVQSRCGDDKHRYEVEECKCSRSAFQSTRRPIKYNQVEENVHEIRVEEDVREEAVDLQREIFFFLLLNGKKNEKGGVSLHFLSGGIKKKREGFKYTYIYFSPPQKRKSSTPSPPPLT